MPPVYAGAVAPPSFARIAPADITIGQRYETQLLMTLRGERAAPVRRLVEFLHRTLLTASAYVVFHDHRRVLRRVGYTPRSFRRDCQAIYRMVMHNRTWQPRSRSSTGKLAA